MLTFWLLDLCGAGELIGADVCETELRGGIINHGGSKHLLSQRVLDSL